MQWITLRDKQRNHNQLFRAGCWEIQVLEMKMEITREQIDEVEAREHRLKTELEYLDKEDKYLLRKFPPV